MPVRFSDRRVARAKIALPSLTGAFVRWLRDGEGPCPVLRARENSTNDQGDQPWQISNAA